MESCVLLEEVGEAFRVFTYPVSNDQKQHSAHAEIFAYCIDECRFVKISGYSYDFYK